MELDSIFATALKSLFRLGNELFGLQSLAERGFLAGGNARSILRSLRADVANITAALDGIERQIDTKWPK